MRPEYADVLRGLLLWSLPALFALLALQRPAEKFNDVLYRYRVLVLGHLGLGLMFLRGGWRVLAYAAIALVALVIIGYVAEALHRHHTRAQERTNARSR